jgi:DNA-binding transcriptional ArsR family regulator
MAEGIEREAIGEQGNGQGNELQRGRKVKKTLDIFPYKNMIQDMARAATTSDAFNAVAEPRRREILNFIALQERPVGEIVDSLGMEQPSVSKHLRVLLEVGLVNVRRDGRRMLYRTNAEAIRPLHEWTETFARYWRHQLSRIKERAEGKSSPSKDSGAKFIPRGKDDYSGNKN